MNWKSVDQRSIILLQLVIVSLFFPIPVSSISIILFLLHSFFNRNFLLNLKAHPHRSWVWLSVLFFGVNAASLIYTENMEDGLRRLETMQPFLWLPLCMASIDYSVILRKRNTLINTFFFACILSALVALAVALFYVLSTGSLYDPVMDDGVVVKEYYFTYLRLSRIIMHPGYLSLYIGIAIYLGFGLIRSGTCWLRSKAGGYALLCFLLVFLFMLQGRMNLLAFGAITFLAFIVFLFRRSRPARALYLGTLLIGSIALLFVILPKDVTRRFTEFKSFNYQMDAHVIHKFNGVTLRLAEWSCAWDVIETAPISGVGLGDAKESLLESYERNNFVVGLRRKFNCHNQYLESWLGAGLPALLLLLCLLLYALHTSYRKKDGILAMIVLYFFLSMLTESMLIRHKAVTLFNVLLPFLIFTTGWEYKKNTVEKAEK